jgi:hypothetical protein
MALYAGYACPREWKDRLTTREYDELCTLASLEHIGPERDDHSRALCARGIMHSSGNLKSPVDIDDLKPIQHEKSPEQQYHAFAQYARIRNAKLNDKPSQASNAPDDGH